MGLQTVQITVHTHLSSHALPGVTCKMFTFKGGPYRVVGTHGRSFMGPVRSYLSDYPTDP